MMVCTGACGLDQWVTSIWRHVSLGVGVKKDKNPSLVMDECFGGGVRSCFWA